MKCLYINLDSASARREGLEASFRAHAPAGWELIRIPAFGPDDVGAVAGAITTKEKACWRSHQAAIAAALDDADDVLILEDDTRLGPRTFAMLERVRTANLQWDLLFTEVGLEMEDLLFYAQRYPSLAASGKLSVQDLARRRFTAAAGYMVRGASKAKLSTLLGDVANLDRAYDYQLQHLTHAGHVQSLFCFPFITQPGAQAGESQIQLEGLRLRDRTHLAYRRLMCVDRDLDALEAELTQLEAIHGDRGAALMGKVFGVFTSVALLKSVEAAAQPATADGPALAS